MPATASGTKTVRVSLPMDMAPNVVSSSILCLRANSSLDNDPQPLVLMKMSSFVRVQLSLSHALCALRGPRGRSWTFRTARQFLAQHSHHSVLEE